MSISKIKIAFKWLFGGTEAVVDYVLGVLNSFLASDSAASKVKQGYELADKVLGYLRKYEDWCPSKWRAQYDETVNAVEVCVSAFADSKITQEEIKNVTRKFKLAYAAWIAEG